MRLLICDDHGILLDALSLVLSDHGHTIVAKALDPDEAVEAARRHQPDVCLMDVIFPMSNGLTAIGRIQAVSPDTKVVILAGSISTSVVSDAIAQGAAGLVSKAKPIEAVLDAIQMAHRGSLAVDAPMLQDALRDCPENDDPLRALKLLTRREWEVLLCIVDGLSTLQMADQLGVHRTTACTHVQNLLAKLGVHSRLQAAAMINAHACPETWPPHLRSGWALRT